MQFALFVEEAAGYLMPIFFDKNEIYVQSAVYWVSKTMGSSRDVWRRKLMIKKIVSEDLRVFLLWPSNLSASIVFYIGGITAEHIESGKRDRD